MLPFSTSIFQFLNETKINTRVYQCIDSKFILERKDGHNVIVQYHDITLNSAASDSGRQSCSNLPKSTRKDRFKNRNEYQKMYSYNGLTDTRHYLSIKRILKTINQWDFNIFALERFSTGSPLTYLSINLFEVHDLINYFELDISKLYQFFMTIERSYHPSNPYHNALHAADVTQAINCIIQDKKIWCQFTREDVLCSLLSSICHDVDHPGLNNTFMNNSQHHLSTLYKKESVLENHHWAFSLSVLMETKLFSHFDTVLWKSVTDACRSLIRATDISKQNTYIDDFNKKLLPTSSNQEINLIGDNKLLVLQMAIKCADICNPCRRWDICNCWAYLVTEEFFQQGDKEREMSLAISPIMDREKTKLAIVQKDFINYLVLPLFRVWDQFINSDISRTFLTHIDCNHAMWQLLAGKSTPESDSIILHSIQSLYDRMQLMQVMDYTSDHQLSHLQRLRLLVDATAHELEGHGRRESDDVDETQNLDPLRMFPLADMIEEEHTKLYQQYRRGSLPLMPSNRDPGKKHTPGRSQKLMIRRTSLQPGQGFTTSMTSTTVNKTQFPTSCRRKSAPAIKIIPVFSLDPVSGGRRGSLCGAPSTICSTKLCSGATDHGVLCSSQSQAKHHHHANSMTDIRAHIPQVS